MSVNEIGKMTNPQLKKALTTMVTAETTTEPTNQVLLEEIRNLRSEVAEIKNIKQEVKQLSTQLKDAYKIINQQQIFLEVLDSRERQKNLIITGLSEESDETGDGDDEKVRNVLTTAGYSHAFDVAAWEMKRLGQQNDQRKRPLRIVVENQGRRNAILEKAKNLKQAGGDYSRIYVKKDVHPAVRKEMARLRNREKEEKEKPENVGVNIYYDGKDRVLYRDGNIIDRYNPIFFK